MVQPLVGCFVTLTCRFSADLTDDEEALEQVERHRWHRLEKSLCLGLAGLRIRRFDAIAEASEILRTDRGSNRCIVHSGVLAREYLLNLRRGLFANMPPLRASF